MNRDSTSRALQSQVADCLLREWDPIGVQEFPEAQDEYDSYVGGIVALLMRGAVAVELSEHLWRIETERMGLAGDRENAARVAALLKALAD